jgi:hypothetical protein
MLFNSGLFRAAEEKQSGDIPTRVSPYDYGSSVLHLHQISIWRWNCTIPRFNQQHSACHHVFLLLSHIIQSTNQKVHLVEETHHTNTNFAICIQHRALHNCLFHKRMRLSNTFSIWRD